jgi:hypothetical protein
VNPTSASPALLAWGGVTAGRMARQALTQPATDLGPAEVAALVGGAHARSAAPASAGSGGASPGATRTDIQRALWEDRSLVKTCGPRGTVHLLPAADLAMGTGALQGSASVRWRPIPPPVRFTPGQAQEVIAAIGEALADAQGDRRGADRGDHGYSDRGVGRRADDGGGGGRWPRWHQLTSTAAHRGRLCFGPTQGPG